MIVSAKSRIDETRSTASSRVRDQCIMYEREQLVPFAAREDLSNRLEKVPAEALENAMNLVGEQY